MTWLLPIVFVCSVLGAPAPAFAGDAHDRPDAASWVAAADGGELPQPAPCEEQASPDELAGAGPMVPAAVSPQCVPAVWLASAMPPSADRTVPLPPPVR